MINKAHSPLYYLPSVSWFLKNIHSDEIHFDIGINYQKNLKLNRCHIAGANGIILLSIPLEKGRHQYGLIKDLHISFTNNWQKIHWNSIYSSYGKAPFFIYYEEGFKKIFSLKITSLTEWNFQLLQYCFGCLKLTNTLIINEEPTVVSIIQNTTGAANLPQYSQVFEQRHGFMPDLSILDLIFNLGPDAKDYLTRIAVK